MSDPILAQLKRIRGQLDGIISMYEGGQKCVLVVRQAIAASNSLKSVVQKLLSDEASRCTHERHIEELDEVVKELFKY